MEDCDIIELYFKRDEKALENTASKYGKLCHNISIRIVGEEHIAEECVNDVYLGAWQSIPPERPSSLPAFLIKIARNISIKRLKHKLAAKRNSNALVSLDELEEIIPDKDSFSVIENKELGQWISDFLYSESEEVRNIFIRKYWFFDSITDLCEKFGHSESKIKSVLFRTRNKLRAYLAERGVMV